MSHIRVREELLVEVCGFLDVMSGAMNRAARSRARKLKDDLLAASRAGMSFPEKPAMPREIKPRTELAPVVVTPVKTVQVPVFAIAEQSGGKVCRACTGRGRSGRGCRACGKYSMIAPAG